MLAPHRLWNGVGLQPYRPLGFIRRLGGLRGWHPLSRRPLIRLPRDSSPERSYWVCTTREAIHVPD